MTQQLPAGKIRCPNCGALNAEAAEWCGQCLQRFHAPEPPPPRTGVASPPPPPVAGSVGATAPAAQPGATETPSPGTADAGDGEIAIDPAAVGTKRGAFEVTEQGIQWSCRVCETKNPIEATICSACGAPFAETVRDKREDQVEGDPNNAAMYSLFLPGAGHGYLGLWGDAIARAIISVFSVGVTVVAFVGGAPLVAFVFGLLSFALWILAAHDAFREASHQSNQVLLKTRYYSFVMLGILGLLFMMLMVTYLSVRAQQG